MAKVTPRALTAPLPQHDAAWAARNPVAAKKLGISPNQPGNKGGKGGQGQGAQQPPAYTAKYQGLNPGQAGVVNSINQGDQGMQNAANAQLPQVQTNFQTPFNFNALPQAPGPINYNQAPQMPQGPANYQSLGQLPGQGNFQDYQNQAVNSMQDAFSSRFDKQFKQQTADAQQQLFNQGIPFSSDPNSEYQQHMAPILQSQNDARTQNIAQAYGMAGTQAAQMAGVSQQSHQLGAQDLTSQYDQGMGLHQQGYQDLGTQYAAGTQAYNDAYGRQEQQRMQPVADYQALHGGVSSMPSQNMGYSYQLGGQDNQAQNQLYVNQHSPSGGGGGGGSASLGGYAGTGLSYQDYLAQKAASDQSTLNFQYTHNPQYQQPQQPSPGAQLGGSIAGSVLGGLAQGIGGSWAKNGAPSWISNVFG